MSIKGFEVGGVQERYDYTALDNTPANLVQDGNYVHTDNNFTNADKTKLDGIATGANKTIIDSTLTQSGQAADAKATGDELEDLKSATSELEENQYKSMPHDTASGSIASFPDGAAMPVRDLSVDIEPVQAGSGDPSPDNIRPISGWTGATVTRTGINVWDEEWEVGDYNESNGAKYNTTTTIRSKNLIPVVPNTRYYFNVPYTVSSSGIRIFFYDANGDFIRYERIWANEFPTIANSYYITFALASTYGATYNHDISINYPATDTSYHAYQGETYSITFPSSAGTVYGGTLDVTQGKLTVDRAIVDLGTLNWSKSSGTSGGFYTTNQFNYRWASDTKMLCSRYKFDGVRVSASYFGDNGTLTCFYGTGQPVYEVYIKDESLADKTASAFKTEMSGVQLVYELATPIVYDLTSTEVSTLLGTNNIFADCGDTAVDYYADPTLYINRKIAAAVAALS